MNRDLKISRYCIIRNNSVIADNTILISVTGTENDFLNHLYQSLGISYPKYHKMDALCKLGFLTTEFLLQNMEIERYQRDQTGIILSNSSSSLVSDIRHQHSLNDRSEYFPSPSVFVYTLPNVVIGEICIRHKIMGEGCFFITPAFDPVLLCRQTQLLFLSGIKCCIAGWAETDGNNYESVFFLVEECNVTDSGIVNFSPDNLEKLYTRK